MSDTAKELADEYYREFVLSGGRDGPALIEQARKDDEFSCYIAETSRIALQKAIKMMGGSSKVKDKCGYSRVLLHQVCKGKRRLTIDVAQAVEKATGGAISVAQLMVKREDARDFFIFAEPLLDDVMRALEIPTVREFIGAMSTALTELLTTGIIANQRQLLLISYLLRVSPVTFKGCDFVNKI